MAELYIGLMSGTSVDAIDSALVAIENDSIEVIKVDEFPLALELKKRLLRLFEPGTNEIDQAFGLGQELSGLYAAAVNRLLESAQLTPEQIIAIGCHGQTIRHRPNAEHPFTVQIGDASTLAIKTGIPVIHQFRQADIALGGQGAPLVPAFHRAVFGSENETRCIINIGGISNITHLPTSGPVTGWDSGPGNGLMDNWVQKHKAQPYDRDGEWAASGRVIPELLHKLLDHNYFKRAAPKSTGKEEFTPSWLAELLETRYAPADVQATLLALTTHSIARDIEQLALQPERIYLCGGGAYNPQLVAALRQRLAINVTTTAELGITPNCVEAVAFAWLAKCFWHREPGNLPEATGASRPAILGQLALP